MKKKFSIFIFCVLFLQLFCFAQLKFGVKAGVPFNIQNLEINNAKIETSRPFNVGLTSECIVPVLNLGIEISALYELEKIYGQRLIEAVNVSYLILPVNMKLKFGFSPFNFFVFLGPSLEVMLYKSGDIVFNNNSNARGLPSLTRFSYETFNWGANAGFGIQFLNVQLSIAFFYNFDASIKEIPNDLFYQYDSNSEIKSKQNGLVLSLACFF